MWYPQVSRLRSRCYRSNLIDDLTTNYAALAITRELASCASIC